MTSTIIGARRATPRGIVPVGAFGTQPMPGHTLFNLKSAGFYPMIAGGAVGDPPPSRRGYNAAGDLLDQTADGVNLNTIWDEYQKTVALNNAERTKMIQFLTFPVQNAMERVAQVSGARFEKASEYGEPVGIRPNQNYYNLGFDMDWYDLAARYTWKFLADAPRSQVDANNQMALEADNILIFNKVMDTLFNPANRLADINGVQDVNVYALYNGDGTVPPKYKSTVHDGTHTHYLASGAANIDSGDVDLLIQHLKHHGYSKVNGYSVIGMFNSRETAVIKTFRIATGASNDFIPATGQPGMYIPSDITLLGGQPANTYKGFNVVGSYGDMLILEEDTIPPAYCTAIATGGPENLNNPVGIREHGNASLRGLRLVKGPNPDYPLIDSFYQRGFGTGIRQRGGAVVMQITASPTYTKPTVFV